MAQRQILLRSWIRRNCKEEIDDQLDSYGMNHQSIFTSLHHLDICSGVLVPDIKHDVL